MLLEFAASLLPVTDALAAPNLETLVILVTRRHNQMTNKDLDRRVKKETEGVLENPGESKVQKNAYSMHAATKPSKHQAHGGFWPAMGSGEREIL
jgi:hypothetical protein